MTANHRFLLSSMTNWASRSISLGFVNSSEDSCSGTILAHQRGRLATHLVGWLVEEQLANGGRCNSYQQPQSRGSANMIPAWSMIAIGQWALNPCSQRPQSRKHPMFSLHAGKMSLLFLGPRSIIPIQPDNSNLVWEYQMIFYLHRRSLDRCYRLLGLIVSLFCRLSVAMKQPLIAPPLGL